MEETEFSCMHTGVIKKRSFVCAKWKAAECSHAVGYLLVADLEVVSTSCGSPTKVQDMDQVGCRLNKCRWRGTTVGQWGLSWQEARGQMPKVVSIWT